jgi:hypothetical protein
VLSFIVGFAMLGSITFLPNFLQYVSGASATLSGVRTLPMVIGLLVTAVGSGMAVARPGKCKAFPIAGGAVMAIGLFLLSRMDAHTPVWLQSLYMVVLGAGIGLIMQILTLVVQNTADYRDLGAATSGVTFFRTLGGAFGASIMGTVARRRSRSSSTHGRDGWPSSCATGCLRSKPIWPRPSLSTRPCAAWLLECSSTSSRRACRPEARTAGMGSSCRWHAGGRRVLSGERVVSPTVPSRRPPLPSAVGPLPPATRSPAKAAPVGFTAAFTPPSQFAQRPAGSWITSPG